MDNFNLNFHVNDSLQPAEEKSLSLYRRRRKVVIVTYNNVSWKRLSAYGPRNFNWVVRNNVTQLKGIQ